MDFIIGVIILSITIIVCCGFIASCDITIIKEIRQFRIVMQDLLNELERK